MTHLKESIRPATARAGTAALVALLLGLLAAGCAAHREMTVEHRDSFTRATVAVIKAGDRAFAEELVRAMKENRPLPADAEIILIRRLDTLSPALAREAARLQSCEVSEPVPPWDQTAYAAYVILQRGGEPGSPCRGGKKQRNLAELYQQVEEKAGEIFIGLLALALVAASIALPIILLD